jgi:predicted outer membrane repeat protein
MPADSDISLSDVTIEECNADSGGDIYQFGGTLSIARSFVQDNSATCQGGGIYATTSELFLDQVDQNRRLIFTVVLILPVEVATQIVDTSQPCLFFTVPHCRFEPTP